MKLHRVALFVIDRQVRVTQSLLNFCNLFLRQLNLVLNIVDLRDCMAGVFGMLLPFDALLLVLSHLESIEVKLLLDRLSTVLLGAQEGG